MRFRGPDDRAWDLRVDIAAAERMRDLAGVDLIAKGSTWADQLTKQPEAVANAIYAACKPQADARGMDDIRFGRMLRSGRCEVFKAASEALWESIGTFFPRAQDLPKARSDEPEQHPRRDQPTGWRLLWEMAGYVGIDPGPRTQRELTQMYVGRRDAESRLAWSVGSSAMAATLATAGSKARPAQINPWTTIDAEEDEPEGEWFDGEGDDDADDQEAEGEPA